MQKPRSLAYALVATGVLSATAMAQAPSTADFMRTLEQSLLKLKPMGMSERQVLFSNVRQGRSSGGSYPFQADVLIRDYGSGYPPNGYYGETCIGRLPAARFNMVRDDFGGWVAQGALTPNDRQCSRNPAQGVSAVPLASLAGAAASPGASSGSSTAAQRSPAAATTAAPTPPSSSSAREPANAASLRTGEYACYGRGGMLMAGMGFRLAAGGRYTDIDGQRAGRYTLDPARGTVSFSGGHLGGQTATLSGGASAIRFSNMVSCEPWGRGG